jgi:REG-2-like HAD superfamily hydrolase
MARETGLSLLDEEGDALYQKIESKLRREREEAERMRDPARIRAVWLKMAEEWLTAIGSDPARARDWLDEFLMRMFAGEDGAFSPFEDAEPALRAVRSKGVKVGVLSNWDHTLHLVLQQTGLDRLLDFAIASLEVGIEKPHPAIFAAALGRAETSPDAALHVGDDYEDDYLGATNAGWHALLLDRRGGSTLTSDHNTIRSLSEVIKWVER